jgi:hypothetical protein
LLKKRFLTVAAQNVLAEFRAVAKPRALASGVRSTF